MLTREDNELITRVGPDTPMGRMMRRYWIPALRSDEVVAGGDPRRVRLLGENLVAFRDDKGRVGLLDEACPHRGASLALARAEGCGLRCLYHGWKVAGDGEVLETPPEPEESGLRQTLRAKTYPVREAAGAVWAYMGPPEHEPPPMDFVFCHLPVENVQVMKIRSECNYLQMIEGVIDSAHSVYLHNDSLRGHVDVAAQANSGLSSVLGKGSPSTDGKPRLEVRDTPYGFRYASIRKADSDPDKLRYIRVTLWMPPFYGMFPAPKGRGNMQVMVPIDDENSFFYTFTWRYSEPILEEERIRNETAVGFRMGDDIIDPVTFAKKQTRTNNWLQDRERMRRGESWSGIKGVNMEDLAIQESMGPIVDRTKEHLGSSDAAIARMRRLMINSARELDKTGRAPIGLRQPVEWRALKAEDGFLPTEASWETALATAGTQDAERV